jgi:L-galactose dehydrogenase
MIVPTQNLSAGAPAGATPLEYRELGKTGLRVSVVGFGASPLGDVFGRTDPAQTVAAVHHAVECGINLFDVSPYYGLTLAEARLGEALEGRREKVVLATKCGRYGADEFDFSAQRITAGLEDSLRRLRTDHVDLLQAHDVEFAHIDQIVEETVPALRKLQQQGKARHIGITGLSLKNLTAVAERVDVDCMISYCRYNLMVSDLDEELMPFAFEHGIGIINASPLHMGILTAHGPAAWHPASAEVIQAGRRVVELCEAHGVDAPQLALHYCLQHPHVASTLVGMATRAQVDANLSAARLTPDPELMAKIEAIIAPVHNRIWPSGLPENRG